LAPGIGGGGGGEFVEVIVTCIPFGVVFNGDLGEDSELSELLELPK
jgi:hypothetical protein